MQHAINEWHVSGFDLSQRCGIQLENSLIMSGALQVLTKVTFWGGMYLRLLIRETPSGRGALSFNKGIEI